MGAAQSTIEIRAAEPEEAPVLTKIAHAAKRHWGYEEPLIQLWSDQLTVTPKFVADSPVYCAVSNGQVVAFYALSGGPKEFELEHMWVHPSHMRTGVGARLFQDAVQTVAARGGLRPVDRIRPTR